MASSLLTVRARRLAVAGAHLALLAMSTEAPCRRPVAASLL
jgi:hypothetical protein